MPKIVVSLRSVMLYERSMFCAIDNQKTRKEFSRELSCPNLIKSIEYLNFRHFRHFRQFRHFFFKYFFF